MVRVFVMTAIVTLLAMALGFWLVRSLLFMPHPITEASQRLSEVEVADLERELHVHIDMLAMQIGERHVSGAYESLLSAETYLIEQLENLGYDVQRQPFLSKGQEVANLWAMRPGHERQDEVVVIGAHYDTAVGTPGANDNGSGVAALMALAAWFNDLEAPRSLMFVLFTNEEPPHFQAEDMGSLVFARQLAADKVNVVAMLSLETMGYFTDEPATQKYPRPLNVFYPDAGNFIAFVGNFPSRGLLRSVVQHFRSYTSIPAEGAALPEALPGVGWSDHWSFWQFSYPAVMVTDTAPFRYPHYHRDTDTIDKIDFNSLARVTAGLIGVVDDLVHGRIAVGR